MPARLFCKTGELAGSEFAIDREATIGRVAQNDITLPSHVVSSQQARIFFDDEETCYFLEDLGSRNGTRLDGVLVTAPVRLRHLHAITFAEQHDFIFLALTMAQADHTLAMEVARSQTILAHDAFAAANTPPTPRSEQPAPAAPEEPEAPDFSQTRLTDDFPALPELDTDEASPDEAHQTRFADPFQVPSDAGEPDTSEKTRFADPFQQPSDEEPETPDFSQTRMADDFPALPSLADAASAPAAFALEVTMPGGAHTRFSLRDGSNIVGREEACDIRLNDPSISRRHTKLTVRNGRVFAVDLGSKNGTFVAHQKALNEVEARPGTSIRFGLKIEARLAADE